MLTQVQYLGSFRLARHHEVGTLLPTLSYSCLTVVLFLKYFIPDLTDLYISYLSHLPNLPTYSTFSMSLCYLHLFYRIILLPIHLPIFFHSFCLPICTVLLRHLGIPIWPSFHIPSWASCPSRVTARVSAFQRNAQQGIEGAPAPGIRSDVSPRSRAARFSEWWSEALVDVQGWCHHHE